MEKMEKIKKIKKKLKYLYTATGIEAVAIAGALGFTWVLTHAFIMAFLHPSKQVLIAIDRYGEALPELPLVIFVVISSTYYLFTYSKKNFRRFYKKRDKLQKKLKKLQEPEEIRFILDEEETPKNIPYRCPVCKRAFEVRPCKKPAMVTCPYCQLVGIIE